MIFDKLKKIKGGLCNVMDLGGSPVFYKTQLFYGKWRAEAIRILLCALWCRSGCTLKGPWECS